MDNLNLENAKTLYFVGIGGIAMSATAALAKKAGFEVLGSDQGIYEPSLSVLKNEQIKFFPSYDAANISNANADIYILSSGEDETNPEVAWLLEHGIRFWSFPEFLAKLTESSIRIVVGGTHGKSTTSAWLGHILKNVDDSSFMVGAVLPQYQANFYQGTGHYFVFEGDEYKSLFDDPTPKMKYYNADLLLLNNLELDHPDLYSSLEEIKNEFTDCVQNLPDDGLVVFNADDANLNHLVYSSGVRSFSFGADGTGDVRLLSLEAQEGMSLLTVENRLDPQNIKKETYAIKLFGHHNLYNALAVITSLRVLGFQPEQIAPHLTSFSGLKRRFEKVLDTPEFLIVDDYAHHPTAVRETLEAAKAAYPKRRLWAVFEPHTYSRTETLLDQLAESFNAASLVLLAPIYSAREKGQAHRVTDKEVLEKVQANNPNTRSVENKSQALSLLSSELQAGDMVVIMSVGSFNTLAYELKDKLTKKI